MKLKLLLSAAFAAALLIASPRACLGAAAPATTNATTSVAATNVNTDAALAALFGDPVVAKGKGFEIKQSDLDEVTSAFKARAAAQGQSISPDQLVQIQAMALDEFIGTKLLVQKATDADRAQGKKDTDTYISGLVKQAGSLEAVEQKLQAGGKSLDDLRGKISQQATATATLIRELGIVVTDAEAKKYYADHPADTEVPEQVHVRHILFFTVDPQTLTPLADAAVKAKRKEVDAVLKRARAGEDFSALARENSEDTSTKDGGGELPAFSHGEMLPEFDAAAFSLTNNQISDVVTTKYGFHIIKLIDRTPASKLAFTDKLPSNDVTVGDAIKNVLTRQKLAPLAPPYLEKLRKESSVEILDPSLKAAEAAAQTAATNAPAASPMN
ncbi:MAG TPA: peptidylprolyl isomerase [Dongiaceae bacterium]|jgi:parvulin-like peptidyl-prolyl isomerase|nr:peptidylprolyl isomerase [Dongiaceae bacterium]